MLFLISWYALIIFYSTECAVLDPALYLQPSPPVKQIRSAGCMWLRPKHTTVEVIPENILASNIDRDATISKARTFWPKIRTDYRLGSIHIPLTFSVSGSYGGYGAGGAVGSSYASVAGIASTKLIASNKPSLAGAGYDNFNSGPTVVRIYGSSDKPAWSGWGNGKWGHYGKG